MSTTQQRPNSSRRASGDKRSAILDAALRSFAERGVHAVAVPEIAETAGVATGTIYRYFESKEALINALYRREKTAVHEYLYGSVERDGQDEKALFDQFWQRVVSLIRERPDTYRFVELQDHRAYLDEESLALERSVLRPIVNHIKGLQRRGVYRDDVRDRVLMAMVWGAIVNLFKAERMGLLSVRRADLEAARELAWQMYSGPPL